MTQTLATDSLMHTHRFDEGNPLAEKNTLRVAVLTAMMMVIEIAGGWYYNSMALLADAAISVLAIIALFGGKLWGASWLDPMMGLAGAVLVAVWSYGLLRDTGRVLLDAEMNAPVVAEIREVITASPVKARLRDLHVWRVGKGKYACILSLATDNEASPEFFKKQLSIHKELVHISIEINKIDG